jgi:DNA-binding MarR family transcriptional regulator
MVSKIIHWVTLQSPNCISMTQQGISSKEWKILFIIDELNESGDITRRQDIWRKGARDIFKTKEDLSKTLQDLRERGHIECTSNKCWKLT